MTDWRDQRRERFERERAQRALKKDQPPKLDTMPPSRLTANQIDERIAEAIQGHYDELVFPLVAEALAHERRRGDSELEIACKKLEAQVSKFEAEVAQLRALVFTLKAEQAEKSAPTDLSRLPQRQREFN